MSRVFRVISCIVTLMMILTSISVFAQGTTKISAENVTAETGESVQIPIKISGNNGICGATISVEYDQSLVLTEVEQGNALSTLVMTKPGKLTDNPVKIGWDGMEADFSNGIIAILTFTVPDSPGIYDVNISYKKGDIVNGELKAVDVDIQNSSVTVSGEVNENLSSVTVGTVAVKKGGSVDVPVSISGNTGICGATISFLYDEDLVLTKVEQGSALSALVMTKPGKLSENPVKIGWDGMDEDSSNGIVAVLTFTVPDVAGEYDITPSYVAGDVVDGKLQPVTLKMNKGKITVGTPTQVTVRIDGKSATLKNESTHTGKIIVASYNSSGSLLFVDGYSPQFGVIDAPKVKGAAYSRIMWWNESLLKPLCKALIINLN